MSEQREVRFYILWAGSGHYRWAYWDTIPKTAKLTGSGNSQVPGLLLGFLCIRYSGFSKIGIIVYAIVIGIIGINTKKYIYEVK